MSPPTEAEIMAELASLAGETPGESEHADAMASAATKLTMIARAQSAGATWRSIAQATGAPNGKLAKREAKRLARKVRQAEMAAWTPLDEEAS